MEICTQNSVRKKLLQHKFRSMEVRTSLLDRVWQQQVAFRNMDLVETAVNNLLDYYSSAVRATKNNIDVLGVVHRELSSFERLFTNNHSQRLLSSANVALLVFQESK